ncbi:hypothetical protein PVK06_011666 [Gossypium arboreum]|uniref:Reverse transcriptase domain-containing protein n=1 Tax=Gossypium arboreum TaxID=29729 RepID=A0ABR0QAD6_GOSAR|nr:hypothetical protein PVK06_011666 [Gossypium arboreum]
MKIIASRFKIIFPKIISQEQAGFIARRNITDNITIAQEVIHSMHGKNKKWMAIKIDLEKAYGRVHWDFIEKSIQVVGIPDYLHRVIMSAITIATMQVLWNGIPTEKFKPERGVRQGCLLSPYLFVLCMEWLGHSFQSSIASENWNPIKLPRSGPNLSHIFFEDDLVIFSKENIKHGILLKNILDQFCSFSGHYVNTRKTNIFFSKGVAEDLIDRLNRILGYQKVQELGKYLSIPLFHKRITKSTVQFVIEKVRSKLCNWDAKQLSLAGRLTLVQLVLLTIPNFFMQSMKIPKKVYEEIERLARQFIWGSNTGGRKLALVDWQTICQPCTFGGLRLRRLHEQNKSFLLKIGLNLISNQTALRTRVLRSKYGMKYAFPENLRKGNSFAL